MVEKADAREVITTMRTFTVMNGEERTAAVVSSHGSRIRNSQQ
jgi:hypothetical protein